MSLTAQWAIFACIGLITGLLAARKGYNFFAWLLTWGLIGLIVLAFLPFATEGGVLREVGQRKRWIGNCVGLGLSAAFVLTFLVVMLVRG
jgi:hypothetical protein